MIRASATRLTSSYPVDGTAGLIFRGSGAKARITATSCCRAATALNKRDVVCGRKLVDGETGESEPGDVHFFDRAPRVLEPIERRERDQLEAGSPQFLEQRAQRGMVGSRRSVRGPPVKIQKAASRWRATATSCDARHGRGAARGTPSMRISPADRGPRRIRSSFDAHVRNAHECGARSMLRAADIVGDHADVEDVVGRRERVDLGV